MGFEFHIPGVDPEFKAGDQQLHTVLLTSHLAAGLGELMEQARAVIVGHRDRMLDHPYQFALDRLQEALDEGACGLGLLAAMADADPPSRIRRVPVDDDLRVVSVGWTRSGMVKVLQGWIEETGSRRMDDYRRWWLGHKTLPSALLVRRQFGTWRAAIEAAGYRYR